MDSRECELVTDVGLVHEISEDNGAFIVEAMEVRAEARTDEGGRHDLESL
jgi:hypothetical protein